MIPLRIDIMEDKKVCTLCPRECGVDRKRGVGFCSVPEKFYISRIALHRWEEPPVSGTRGSGTVFFSGCSLRCVFCQNKKISRSAAGRAYSEDELISEMLRLQSEGAHNINLVTPTHYTAALVPVLQKVRPMLSVPVVWNSGGYEKAETLKMLDGLVDVYLPDLKYFSSELSKKYSSTHDYFAVAREAIREMHRQVGGVRIEDNLIKKGVIVRHLVLPGCRKDSIRIVEELSEILPANEIKISIMRQYTPDFVDGEAYPELKRRVTSFEYDSVLKRATELGFDGYTQGAEAATASYTPDFEI